MECTLSFGLSWILVNLVLIEVFISNKFGLIAARECDQGCEALIISFFLMDVTLDLVRTGLWWLAEASHAR